MVSEKGFVSGIRFKDLKYFLDNYLSMDIINPILFNNYLNKKAENEKNQETINNIIYKDKDGKTIKRVKIKVKAKRNESY